VGTLKKTPEQRGFTRKTLPSEKKVGCPNLGGRKKIASSIRFSLPAEKKNRCAGGMVHFSEGRGKVSRGEWVSQEVLLGGALWKHGGGIRRLVLKSVTVGGKCTQGRRGYLYATHAGFVRRRVGKQRIDRAYQDRKSGRPALNRGGQSMFRGGAQGNIRE